MSLLHSNDVNWPRKGYGLLQRVFKLLRKAMWLKLLTKENENLLLFFCIDGHGRRL